MLEEALVMSSSPPFQLLKHEDVFLGPDSKCLKLVNYISVRT